MALEKTVVFSGVTVPKTYTKVVHFNGNSTHMHFTVAVKANKGSVENISTHGYTLDYDSEGGNASTQAYQYLKTLPEFADATDV
jgi:hypothetical protein